MTDETTHTLKPTKYEPDWLLAEFVINATLTESYVGVTIIAGGTPISGQLVGVRQFFYELAEALALSREIAAEAALANDVRKRFRGLGDDAFELFVKRYRSAEGELEPPEFLHLREARFVTGYALTPLAGLLWRGRLAEVSGFSLGYLTPRAENSPADAT